MKEEKKRKRSSAATPDKLKRKDYEEELERLHESLRPKFGRRFFTELATPRRWPLDAPSPFERERMLDPVPEQRVLGQVRDALGRFFPEIAAAPFVETWGGMNTGGNAPGFLAPVIGMAIDQLGWLPTLASGSVFAVLGATLWLFIGRRSAEACGQQARRADAS